MCPEKYNLHPIEEITVDVCKELFKNTVHLERYLNLLLQKGFKLADVKKCPEPECTFAFWVEEGTKSWECGVSCLPS